MKETFLHRLAASLVSRPFVDARVQNLAGQAKVAERPRTTSNRLPGRSFHVDAAMEFAVYHQYLLCVARPVAPVRGERRSRRR